MKKEALLVIILLLLCSLLFLLRLGVRPLWDTDEGMHAATSKEMVLGGDWVTTTFNGEKFYDKPILHNWFVAISFLVFGFTEFAARLPAAILGLGGVFLTYLLGRKMFGTTVGFLSGAILATNPEYIMFSRSVVHDISLSFFVTLAFLLFYQGYASEKHRRAYFFLFYASLGFAVLAKGPVGLLLPVLVIGLFLVIQRKLDFLRDMEIGWGILIFLAVAAPWYILISLRNKEYFGYFFIQNNVMRFLSSKAQHRGPFYYYIPVLLGSFFPWSCLLPLALLQVFRGPLKKISEGRLFLLLWFFVTFVFFSLASSKLGSYILPLFPAASLLVGGLWNDLIEAPSPRLRKGFLYSFLPVLVILPVGLLYLWIRPPMRFELKYGVSMVGHGYVVLWMIGGTAISLWLLLRHCYRASFLALAGTVVSIIIFVEVAIIPLIDPYFTTKGLAQKLDGLVPPGQKLVFFNSVKDTALFYTDRRALLLTTPEELRDFLCSEKKVFCVINKSLYRDLDHLEKISHIVDQEGGKLIISNHRRILPDQK